MAREMINGSHTQTPEAEARPYENGNSYEHLHRLTAPVNMFSRLAHNTENKQSSMLMKKSSCRCTNGHTRDITTQRATLDSLKRLFVTVINSCHMQAVSLYLTVNIRNVEHNHIHPEPYIQTCSVSFTQSGPSVVG